VQQDSDQRSARTMIPAGRTASVEAMNPATSQLNRTRPQWPDADTRESMQGLIDELAAVRNIVERLRAALLSQSGPILDEQSNGPSDHAQLLVINNSGDAREEVVGEQDTSTAERSTARE
jgi:hypothetical protein